MNEASNHTAFFRGLRQMFGVTLILLLLCGFVFPVLLTGISSVVFPAQAGGSLVYADGRAVGSKYVGQEFTKPYFMKGRPSAYHYNTYYEDAQGNRYYSDGSPFAGVSSGSNNYAPSNPALLRAGKGRHRNVPRCEPGCHAGGDPDRPDDRLRLWTRPSYFSCFRTDPDPSHRKSFWPE